MKPLHCVIIVGLTTGLVLAQSSAIAPIARRIPPLAAIKVPADRLEALRSSLERLERRFKQAGGGASAADVEVYVKAARFALMNEEFYKNEDPEKVEWAIRSAEDRLDYLLQSRTPWIRGHGTIIHGYRSAIDGSVQPYALTVPEGIEPRKPVPLYIWLHGRSDTQTDLHFIHDRTNNGPQGPMKDPVGAIILEPFGRQCLGWKSTGEIDVFEALEQVKKQYGIDEDRIVLTGYSMGGAGVWHIGAHYTEHFCALQPGAGFVDLARYQNMTPDKYPAVHERTLWGLYDVPEYVMNLFNIPVVAYNGEVDRQRASGEIMAELYRQHGRRLTHIIGPGLGHVPPRGDLLRQVQAELEPAVRRGRDRFPQEVHLQTRTLRYNRMHWVEIVGLGEHWRDARVDARRSGPGKIELTTRNVRHLRLSPPDATMKRFPAGFEVVSNGTSSKVGIASDRLIIDAAANRIVDSAMLPKNGKRHGLQGPIDDVLLAPFLVVAPTGKSKHPMIEQWVEFELDHFARRWRTLYRGELRSKKDTEVTAGDIARYHLILFGDAESNSLIRRVLLGLPLRWNTASLEIAGKGHDAKHHIALLVYPNPLNRQRYVVLNSGPTHREAHDHTNSLQNPKLPDWAIVDVRTPPDAEAAGKVVDADFFDEEWRVKPPLTRTATRRP